MKLKKEFITHTAGGEQLMICAGGSFNGMIRSNSTAAAIIDILKEEVTKEEIISKMLDIYDTDRETVERDVDKVLDALFKVGAINE